MSDEVYSPPGALPILDLAQLLMRQEGWGWSKALYEAMRRREAAAARRERERERRRGGDGR